MQSGDVGVDRYAPGPGKAEESRREAEPVQVSVLVGRGSGVRSAGGKVVHEAPGPFGDLALSAADASATALGRIFGHATLRFLGFGRRRRGGVRGPALRDRESRVQGGPDRVDLLVERRQSRRLRESGRRDLGLRR